MRMVNLTHKNDFVFKKYRVNRRIWCETTSEYATIPDILRLVEMGKSVVVYSAEGPAKKHRGDPTEDVTARVLLDVLHLRENTHPTLTAPELMVLLRRPLP